MTELLAPIYPLEIIQEMEWPDLSLNPHLSKKVKETVDSNFEATYKLTVQADKDRRSKQKFSDWNDLSKDSKSFIKNGYYIDKFDLSDMRAFFKDHVKNVSNLMPANSYYKYDRHRLFKDSKVVGFVNSFYHKKGLNKIASDMLGITIKVIQVVLHVATEDDIHYKQVLSDVQYNPKTQAIHRDPKPSIKSLLYLNEVGPDDCPFRYIPRSHRWSIPYVTRMASQANCTYNYLDTPDKRKKFLGLPNQKRVTSIVGSIIDDSDPLSEKLLSQEVDFLSDHGNIILFPASGLLHRGGACNPGGFRVNLQITFG